MPTFPAVERAPAPEIVDTLLSGRPSPSRPAIAVPAPKLIVVEVRPEEPLGDHRLLGNASWYCKPGVSVCAKGFPAGGNYAAAGPALRAAICGVQSCTSWRGKTVSVNGIPVKLIDWCQCYWKQPHEKIIDLYHSVFVRTGSKVIVRW